MGRMKIMSWTESRDGFSVLGSVSLIPQDGFL